MIALAKRQYLYLIIGSFNQLQSFKSKTVCTGWLVHDMSYYVMASSHLQLTYVPWSKHCVGYGHPAISGHPNILGISTPIHGDHAPVGSRYGYMIQHLIVVAGIFRDIPIDIPWKITTFHGPSESLTNLTIGHQELHLKV